MREGIPVSTSPKGRLALAAVKEFGARPCDEVTVGELAAAAKVTTGALSHHFGSKLGLYTFVAGGRRAATAGPDGRRHRGVRPSVGSRPRP
jgi:AcrR family transcriptional regulator